VTSPAPGPVTVTLIAASPHVAPGGQDTFTASVTQAGQPVAQVTVRLLEREAGSPAARAAATGVTDATGMVALTATGLTVNAVFHVEGTAAYKAASSPKVTVQVIPGLAVHLSTPTTLMVHAGLPAGPGDAVTLQELSGGIWTDVATRVLGAQGRASFTVVAGQTYRVVLRATMTHGRAISVAVTA
jgi:5-hydroxyisourate hydrolase-like protein (transthyretin family)